MDTLTVDYHFHPNISPLSERKAARKVKKIYERFCNLDIRALICTEHVYKKPRRAYTMMRRYQPHDIFVFPGMEYITREKIDIIIFSYSASIYNYPELKPFAMTYQETVDFVKAHDDLYAFVTHPFSFGSAGIVKRKGVPFTKSMIRELGAVEVEYHVFNLLANTLQKVPGCRKLLGRAFHRLELNQHVPDEYYPHDMKFFAAGSDAHHVFEIGTHCRVPCGGSFTRDNVFTAIISNGDPEVVWIRQRAGSAKRFRASMTFFNEAMMKKRHRLWRGLKYLGSKVRKK